MPVSCDYGVLGLVDGRVPTVGLLYSGLAKGDGAALTPHGRDITWAKLLLNGASYSCFPARFWLNRAALRLPFNGVKPEALWSQ